MQYDSDRASHRVRPEWVRVRTKYLERVGHRQPVELLLALLVDLRFAQRVEHNAFDGQVEAHADRVGGHQELFRTYDTSRIVHYEYKRILYSTQHKVQYSNNRV